MPSELAEKIANMLVELQLVTNEHDKNVVVDNLCDDDFGFNYERQ